MAGLILNIKILLLIWILVPSVSMAQYPYDAWDTGSDELINKEIVTHRIIDKQLIDMITEYDNMYSQFIDDTRLGLELSFRTSEKTVTYSVGYVVSIHTPMPMLLCEPINGRQVRIIMFNMAQIKLPGMRSVQLSKDVDPSDYNALRQAQNDLNEEDKKNGVIVNRLVTSSFVDWSITFDKYTGEVISKQTPDRTKEYKKSRAERQRREANAERKRE